LNELDNVVNENYLYNYDMNLQKFRNPKAFFGSRRNDIINVFNVENSIKFIDNMDFNEEILKGYLNMFYDDPDNNVFLHSNNYYFDKTSSRIASKDFRITIDDLSRKSHVFEKLYCASIATLMLAGKIEYPIGVDIINSVLKPYGYTSYQHVGNGYLHITLNSNSGGFKTKQYTLSDIKGT
jgi:hypothetical protein